MAITIGSIVRVSHPFEADHKYTQGEVVDMFDHGTRACAVLLFGGRWRATYFLSELREE